MNSMVRLNSFGLMLKYIRQATFPHSFGTSGLARGRSAPWHGTAQGPPAAGQCAASNGHILQAENLLKIILYIKLHLSNNILPHNKIASHIFNQRVIRFPIFGFKHKDRREVKPMDLPDTIWICGIYLFNIFLSTVCFVLFCIFLA